MSRVALEYAKGAVMAACALLGLAICVLARTLNAAWMVFAFGALTWYFVVKARVFSRRAAEGCGRRSR